MGVPSFYRWLVERYPRSVADVVEETPLIENDRPVPVDVSLPNPNGYEFDNLYLDMNGIIHPCFHPEGRPPPSDYDEVFQAVFMYIDRVFSIVRPRQLLYLAIDGVAPRAKMNQQRSRRFRTAKEVEDEASLKAESHGSGENELPVVGQSKKLDSNVITPGTEFMELLSSALHYYINLRMNEEDGWKGIKVILSDASVPGEGEHKIMSYIRLQRNLPGFNPNTRHCLYGLDADLIMLALASHEIHFSVLREEVRKITSRDKITRSVRYCGSSLKKSGVSPQSPAFLDSLVHYISEIKFQFLHVWILREYLMYDLRIPGSTSGADLDRLIDDFVFMCLLVGNDFLPYIPSLAISEGAIDLLMMVYKKEFVRMGGYLTDSFKINFKHMEYFIQAVGSYESLIFRKRIKMKKANGWGSNFSSQRRLDIKHLDCKMSEPQDKGRSVPAQGSANGLEIGSAAEVDEVKLGEDGWKERYYVRNFQLNSENECERIQRQMVAKYIEGLSWVMHYYYEGVCSWQWFYPFHYAPFASDFHGFDNLEIKFTLGKPFKPFDQLMGVLPAASAHALPLSYGKLMKDDSSPIADFYPANFEVDMNGKRFSWQGICKLPFIDEARLLSEIAKLEHTLTDDEKRRNSLGWDILFVHKSNPLAIVIISFSDKSSHLELLDGKAELEIDPKTSGGMNGYIFINETPVWPREICSPIDCWPALENIGVITVFYKYPPSHRHIPNLPEGVILPDKSVSRKDIVPPQLSLYDGASFLLCSRKLMPNSVSGPNLSRFAHRLVLLHIAAKGEIIGKGAEITTVTQNQNKKKKRRSKEEKQNDVAGRHPQPGHLSLASVGPLDNIRGMGDSVGKVEGEFNPEVNSEQGAEITTVTQNRNKKKKRRSKDVKQNGVAGSHPQPGHLSLASVGSLDSIQGMGDSVGKVDGEVNPEVNSEQGAKITQQQFRQDETSDVGTGESGRLLAPCILRDKSVGINIVADGGHMKGDLEYCQLRNIDNANIQNLDAINYFRTSEHNSTLIEPSQSHGFHTGAVKMPAADVMLKKKQEVEAGFVAGRVLEKSVGHTESEQKVLADCNTAEEFPITIEQNECTGIQDRVMDSGTANSSFVKFDNASELIVAHNDLALGGRPRETNIIELVKKKPDHCNSIQKLESDTQMCLSVQFGDIHAAADKVVQGEADPSSKKRRNKSKKRRRVEKVNNEETTEISEISAMKVGGAVCVPGVEESGDVSRVGRSDSCRTVRILEEMGDNHAYVNNKVVDVNVTPGIISGRKRKRYHAPGLKCPDAAGMALETVEPTSGKRKRERSKEKTVCSEDKKEAAVEQLLEKRSADVDISESCCSAFTLNKSGAGIVGGKPRESKGIHVGADGVMEAVAEMKPNDKKRKRSKKNGIVEVGTNENTTDI